MITGSVELVKVSGAHVGSVAGETGSVKTGLLQKTEKKTGRKWMWNAEKTGGEQKNRDFTETLTSFCVYRSCRDLTGQGAN